MSNWGDFIDKYEYLNTHMDIAGITVMYDKGKDNDMTLKSKIINAYRKTKTDMSRLNEDMQHLKKHKSVFIPY